MSNPNREYDKTHLSIDMAEERFIQHRDYLAHCMRWSHVCKFLMQSHRYKTARILEAGCGREMPLPRLIYSNRMSGTEYVGVDVNALECPEMLKKAVRNEKMKIWLMGNTDAGTIKESELPWKPNVIVSLEVWEHMTPKLAFRMIRNLRALASDDCTLFLSTPCWNGSAAANHINETSFQAMMIILAEAGWHVTNTWGTFASQKDYYYMLGPDLQLVFDKLSLYYDSNLVAIMWAPLFPAASRNCLWQCVPGETKTGWLEKVPTPWSQHIDWRDYGRPD
jgi:2-polyprenyl-3-methyl-5-hydroxy-6-metoxy-1,4-benzoquinol methylase